MSLERIPYLYENIFTIYEKPVSTLKGCLSLMSKKQLDELTVQSGRKPFSKKEGAVRHMEALVPDISKLYFEYVTRLEYDAVKAVMNNAPRYELSDENEKEEVTGFFWVQVMMSLIKKGFVFHFADEESGTDTLIVPDEVQAVLKENEKDGYDSLYGRYENVIDIEQILVSLYGVVPPSLFMKYWNREFPELEFEDEKSALLVMRDAAFMCDNLISFTEDFIMHPSMHQGEEERVLSLRNGKPRFMFSEKEFHEIWEDYRDNIDEETEDANGYYEIEYRNPDYKKMKEFLVSHAGEDDGEGILLFIMNYMKKGMILTRVIEYINERFNFTEKLSRKEAEEFFSLYQRLNNSTHMWGNYGWTPKELPESSRPSDTPAANQSPFGNLKIIPKVGRNDPCPCGSGKKYKQCHGK